MEEQNESSAKTAACWSGEHKVPSPSAGAVSMHVEVCDFFLFLPSVLLLCPFLENFPHLVYLEAVLGVHC